MFVHHVCNMSSTAHIGHIYIVQHHCSPLTARIDSIVRGGEGWGEAHVNKANPGRVLGPGFRRYLSK